MKNKKLKRWLRYLLYLIVIAAFIIVFGLLFNNVFINFKFSSINTYYIDYSMLAASLIFGLILGAEHLIHEIRKKKTSWQFNIPRFVLIGIPALIIALIKILSETFTNVSIPNSINFYPNFSEIGAVLFGYILISNFTRKKLCVNKEMKRN